MSENAQSTAPLDSPQAEDPVMGQIGSVPPQDQQSQEQMPEQQSQDLQAQIAQAQDELLRARAEVENIRRRAQEDVSRARKFGTEAFAENLLAVRDSLEAALAAPEQSADTWREGVQVTLRQLTQAFERNALKELAPEAGEKFDPNLHQAISSVPSDHPQGTVAQRLQKGYALAERVLRPALVMVSSGVAPGVASDACSVSPAQTAGSEPAQG